MEHFILLLVLRHSQLLHHLWLDSEVEGNLKAVIVA
jgi:hypothetical protein